MAQLKDLIAFFLLLQIHLISSQNCFPAPKGMDVTEMAYRSPVVVKVQVKTTGSVNHTAVVLETYATRNGGLSKNSQITFGPLKKGRQCPKIRKNGKYVLFLENSKDTEPNYYRIKYNPTPKMKLLKKIQKIVCNKCVKEPKFKKSAPKTVHVYEKKKFTFDCKPSGSPAPVAVFYKDGKVLAKNSGGIKISKRKKGGGKLRIKRAKKSHSGVYTCSTSNFAGTANLTVNLIVSRDDCEKCGKEWEHFCMNGGRCCMLPVVNQTSCRCESGYRGERCESRFVPLPRKLNEIESRYHQQTIAIMAVCLALLFAIFVCYVVYCKFKKSRSKIRKQILNGHVHRDTSEPRPVTAIPPVAGQGIVADDRTEVGVEMTGYRSTNLSEPTQHFTAFTQRPQTYDDVILGTDGQPTSSFQSKYEENLEDQQANNGQEVQLTRVESNGKRSRLRGIAIGQPELHQGSKIKSSEMPTVSKQLEKIQKSDLNSRSSSASSINSHHDPKKPFLPIDERLAHIAKKDIQKPPEYGDTIDNRAPEAVNEPLLGATAPDTQPTPDPQFHGIGRAGRDREPSSTSSGSAHRVTTFSNDGKIEEELLGRKEGDLQGVTPHSPNLSPQSSYQRPSRTDMYLPHEIRTPPLKSPMHEGRMPTQKQSGNEEFGVVYPYYESSQEPHSPLFSSHPRKDSNDDPFSDVQIPDASLGLYSPKSPKLREQPVHLSSPGRYRRSPELSMEVPFRQGPVTVASARHHHLPLLTKEKPESSLNPSSQLLAGSTVSLSSSDTSSIKSERHRDSHKIEV